MNDIFFNSAGLLRSGWRFSLFLFFFIFFGILFGVAAGKLLAVLQVDFSPGTLLFIVLNSSISLVLALAIGWVCGKIFENLPFRALGFWFTENWLKDLLFGLLVGAASISFAVLLAMIFGGLRFQTNDAFGTSAIFLTLGVSFLIFLVAAAFEEALFRGYILQTFSRSGLAWLAILLTSAFFAFAHLSNPNANYISSLNTGIAGIWFGVAYLKTRNLWFPFGIHFIWNWLQGAVFGIEVSGLKHLTTAPVLREIDAGPTWLTGGDYGIEGGIACTIALILSTVLIYFLPLLKPSAEMLALSSAEIPVADKRNSTSVI